MELPTANKKTVRAFEGRIDPDSAAADHLVGEESQVRRDRGPDEAPADADGGGHQHDEAA